MKRSCLEWDNKKEEERNLKNKNKSKTEKICIWNQQGPLKTLIAVVYICDYAIPLDAMITTAI